MESQALWETEVIEEAHAFYNGVGVAFKDALEKTLKLLPEDNAQNRMKQLAYFMESIISAAVTAVATYHDASWEAERHFTESAHQKFDFIRAEQAKVKAPSEQPAGLVLPETKILIPSKPQAKPQ